MKKTSYVILYALFFFLIPIVSAEMYRWTDDQGNTIYSQSPPPDARPVTKVAPPPKPSTDEASAARERLDRQIEQLNAENEKKLEAKKEQEKQQQEAAKNRERCELAKKNLEIMKSRPPNTLYSIGGEEYKRFTPEEYEAQIKSYEETVKKYCR